MRIRLSLVGLASALALGLASPMAQAEWFPYKAESTSPAFAADGVRTPIDYVPLEKAEKKWDICLALPHLKDAYFLGVDYGAVEEARRLGVKLHVMDAGGYDQLNKQISQIEDCVTRGGEAVIIGSISLEGLAGPVHRLTQQNIPAIDVINGINSQELTAKSLVSFYVMGQSAAEYLNKLHPAGSKKIKVGWFPGPAGAGWVEAANAGFLATVKENDAIEMLEPRYGDTGKEVQSKLIEDVLQGNPDIDYIAGTAVTAEAAVGILRSRDLQDNIKILPFYMTPGVYDGIKKGTILAAPTDSNVIQGRISVDQAVRALEGKLPEEYKHVGPKIFVLDSSNIEKTPTDTMLAPKGFKPVFEVK